MINIIVEISKYVLLFLMVFFTIKTFMVLQRRDSESRKRIIRSQIVLMVLFNIVVYAVMFAVKREKEYLMMLVLVIGYILVVQVLYRIIYRKASMVLLNTMCMLLSVGFAIQTRLGIETAQKQFLIASAATLSCFVIPVFIRRVKIMSRLTWVYAIIGIV
ncbi:MAG: FtsW/RodA/SpoVE family cell cycle protein, partial [Eubacterium sp.]|nr:FtsW/RodA/SpoVE family cell cycle protein [Eubacterium sp.]